MDWSFFSEPQFQRLATYWDTLRGGELLPQRVDFRISAVADLAMDLVIWDLIDLPKVKIVFAGQADYEAYENTVSDRVYDFPFSPEIRAVDERAGALLIGLPMAAVVNYHARYRDRDITVRSLALPLADVDGTPRYGVTVSHLDDPDLAAVPRTKLIRYTLGYHAQPIDIGAGMPDEDEILTAGAVPGVTPD